MAALLWGRILTADDVESDPELPERLSSIGERFLILDRFQKDIIDCIFNPMIRETWVKGNTGCGKGAAAGIAVCLYFLAYNDAKVIISRDSHIRAVKVMFGEVASWWRRMSVKPPGVHLLNESIVDQSNRNHEVVVANPLNSEGFTGVHSPHVLFLFDEATAPPLEPRFDLANTQASKFLCLANPRTTSGKFKSGFDLAADPNETQTVLGPYGYRRLITVDGADMLNVRLRRLEHPVSPPGGIGLAGEKYRPGLTIEGTYYPPGAAIPVDVFEHARRIIPGQTGYDVWLGHLKQPDRQWVLCYAHGRFPEEDPEVQVILGSWVKPAVEWWKRWQELYRRAKNRHAKATLEAIMPVQAFGLDVGGSKTGDPSVLTAGGMGGIRAQHTAQISDSTELVEWVIDTARREYGIDITKEAKPVGIDTVGIGWGLPGIFRKRHVKVLEIRGNDPSGVDPKRYSNMRAECYGELGARLNPQGGFQGRPFGLPDDPMLLQELRIAEKVYRADGLCYAITPKRKLQGVKNQIESIEEKIGRSPDKGDSATYLYRAVAMVSGRFNLADWLEAGAL